MTIASAKGYDITIEETKADKSKHSMINFDTYVIRKNSYALSIGNYSNLIKLHKRLKVLLEFNFLNNDKKDIFNLSYNSRYFYIKNIKTGNSIGIQKEYVRQLSADIGKFLYKKMIENKVIEAKKD